MTDAATSLQETFFVNGPVPAIDVYVKRGGDREHHFYLRNLAASDFAAIFAHELEASRVYLVEPPVSALNPEYWETYSEAAEREMREKVGGVIERTQGEVRSLWRADRVPPGRSFRESVGIEPEILRGPVLEIEGSAFVSLAKRLTDPAERMRFAVCRGPVVRDEKVLRELAGDLRTLRMMRDEVRILYSSEGGTARMVFADPEGQHRALDATLQGLAARLSHQHVGPMRGPALRQIVQTADHLGFTVDPESDFVDKDRTVEITLHLGKTRWAEEDLLSGDEKILVYYDRTSGIWASVTL